jgi:microcystin-dependent protein
MASSYSTSLKIQLMANGEDSNTWGTITNTNWNLIEQAVTGVQNITMSNSDYTLSNLNGVSDEARNMVLVVGGTNSDIRQIIAPLVNKFYVISNQTTGGYAITIGGSSGSLITVPNSTTVQVYCDGTNFYSAQTASAGDFNVNGNLSVAGTLTVAGLPAGFSPTGSVTMYAANSAPTGWLLCNGVAVSRTTYAALFAVVGTTFGAGDGSTTFNLPNYTNRMPYGTTVGATGGSADSTLPSHTHGINDPGHAHGASSSSSVSDPGHLHNVYAGLGASPVPYPNREADGNSPTDTFPTLVAYTGITVATSTSISGAYTGISTQNAGVSPTGTNLPPYLGINFIIKT